MSGVTFNIVHIDDDDSFAKRFRNYLKNGLFEYKLWSFSDPAEALSFVIGHGNVNLCLVDLELDKYQDGLSVVETIKLLSSSTNCILLTHDLSETALESSAKVGCSSILTKSEIKTEEKQRILRQVLFTCQHSQLFLARYSKDRLNFSVSIAHNLKRVLKEHWDSVEEIKKGIPNTQAFSSVNKELSSLIKRYSLVERKLNKVLNFHSTMDITPSWVNPCELIKEIVGRGRYRDRTKFESVLDEKAVFWDKDLVGIAIENLLDNGIKFSEGIDEHTPIEIFLHLEVKTSSYKITVRDFGIGVRSDEKHRLKQPNFMGKDAKHGLASFGIGLAEVDKIARLHRNSDLSGSLELFEPPSGRGCIAELILPSEVKLDFS